MNKLKSNRIDWMITLAAHADAYAEVALNHSHQITPNVRIGVTLKGLVGAGNVDLDFKKAQLELREDSWDVVTEAEVQANIKNLNLISSVSEETGNMCIESSHSGCGEGAFGLGVFNSEVSLSVDAEDGRVPFIDVEVRRSGEHLLHLSFRVFLGLIEILRQQSRRCIDKSFKLTRLHGSGLRLERHVRVLQKGTVQCFRIWALHVLRPVFSRPGFQISSFCQYGRIWQRRG